VNKSVTIVIDAGLIGQPARPVVRQLRQAGLVPRVEWSHAGDLPAGTIIAVRPKGDVEPGTVVTITVAALHSD
jgi:beta-lactam-binding protein with PASTA domain